MFRAKSVSQFLSEVPLITFDRFCQRRVVVLNVLHFLGFILS